MFHFLSRYSSSLQRQQLRNLCLSSGNHSREKYWNTWSIMLLNLKGWESIISFQGIYLIFKERFKSLKTTYTKLTGKRSKSSMIFRIGTSIRFHPLSSILQEDLWWPALEKQLLASQLELLEYIPSTSFSMAARTKIHQTLQEKQS